MYELKYFNNIFLIKFLKKEREIVLLRVSCVVDMHVNEHIQDSSSCFVGWKAY